MKPHKGKYQIMMSFEKLKELNMMSLLKDTNNYRMIRVKKNIHFVCMQSMTHRYYSHMQMYLII